MIRIGVREAQRNLSRYLHLVEGGEVIVICRRSEPVAELRAIPKHPRRIPQLGCAKGTFVIPPEFFDPLPEDLLRAFEGRDETDD